MCVVTSSIILILHLHSIVRAGIEVATCIDSDSRGGRAEILHISDNPMDPEFWAPLGGYVDPSSLPMGEPDTEVAAAKISKLFKLSDNGSDVELTNEGPLKKSMMESENVYLLHSTERISLWVGKKSKADAKKNAMHCAVDYLKKVRRFSMSLGTLTLLID